MVRSTYENEPFGDKFPPCPDGRRSTPHLPRKPCHQPGISSPEKQGLIEENCQRQPQHAAHPRGEVMRSKDQKSKTNASRVSTVRPAWKSVVTVERRAAWGFSTHHDWLLNLNLAISGVSRLRSTCIGKFNKTLLLKIRPLIFRSEMTCTERNPSWVPVYSPPFLVHLPCPFTVHPSAR